MMRYPLTVIVLVGSFTAVLGQDHPASDWTLHKPGTKDESHAKDYAACLMSPDAPGIIDARTNKAINDPKLKLVHQKFVLSCMGAKGYVLVPPSKK
jgi:hypothetical protein